MGEVNGGMQRDILVPFGSLLVMSSYRYHKLAKLGMEAIEGWAEKGRCAEQKDGRLRELSLGAEG